MSFLNISNYLRLSEYFKIFLNIKLKRLMISLDFNFYLDNYIILFYFLIVFILNLSLYAILYI